MLETMGQIARKSARAVAAFAIFVTLWWLTVWGLFMLIYALMVVAYVSGAPQSTGFALLGASYKLWTAVTFPFDNPPVGQPIAPRILLPDILQIPATAVFWPLCVYVAVHVLRTRRHRLNHR